jgi:hypothetical protein
MIVDYNYYMDTYQGIEISEEEFERAVIKASSHINNLIMNRDYTNWYGKDYTEQVKMATCSIIEILAEKQLAKQKMKGIIDGTNKNITSEKVGDYSRNFDAVSYKDLREETTNINNKMFEEASTYLWSTGLMNRGVCYVR